MAQTYREKIAVGVDPISEKEDAQKNAAQETARPNNTFSKIARNWFESVKDSWANDTAVKTWAQLNNHVLPYLGKRPIHLIEEQQVARVIRQVADNGSMEASVEKEQRSIWLARDV